MPYILNKTNGGVLTTVNDASTDLTTNLTFVGRNYSGYGEVVNENFLRLLESFSNTTAPSKPIQGQLWFNNITQQLNVSYDGKSFKGVANLQIQSSQPMSGSRAGDLWFDTSEPNNKKLKVFDGTGFILIGPISSTASAWSAVEERRIGGEQTSIPLLKAKIGSAPVAVISNYGDTDFKPIAISDLSENFVNVKRGITLAGAAGGDVGTPGAGSTTATGYYFWGTAAEAIYANTATNAYTAITATNVTLTSSSSDATFYVPFAPGATGDQPLRTDAGITYNPSTNVLSTIASSARYADLAERYAADMIYEPGTVVVIGGDKEVTACEERASTAVAGIVSKNPAYMMNSDAGNDETHPYIALKGRVPCKIIGSIKKGDLLVTSTRFGHACAKLPTDSSNAVIGKALEDFQGPVGVIEVLVV